MIRSFILNTAEEQREVQTLLLRREAMEEEKLNIETTIDKIKERISVSVFGVFVSD